MAAIHRSSVCAEVGHLLGRHASAARRALSTALAAGRDWPAAMSYVVVDPADVAMGEGPHPAASPDDRRISDALGVTAFEVYQVELPPGAETVLHDHVADGHDDVHVILRGDGWLVVDDERVPVSPGQYVAVTQASSRQLVSGRHGLDLTAVCAPARR